MFNFCLTLDFFRLKGNNRCQECGRIVIDKHTICHYGDCMEPATMIICCEATFPDKHKERAHLVFCKGHYDQELPKIPFRQDLDK